MTTNTHTPAALPAVVSPAGDGEQHWFLGGRVTVRLDGEATAGRCSVVEHELAGGMATPLHVQPDDELFLVLEGAIELWLDGDLVRAEAGDLAFVPRALPHAFRVVGARARVMGFGLPAGHELFFRAGGVAVADHPQPPEGPIDVDRLGAAAARAGVTLLGPPPFETAG